MMTRSPVTAANPRRSAAPLPPLRGWRSSTKPCSFCSRSRISVVPSVDTSSTTISWMRIRTASTRRMISSIVSRSLKTGITTESTGSAGMRVAARWSVEAGRVMLAVRARPTAKSDRPIGGVTTRSSGSAQGATSRSNRRDLAGGVLGVAADVEVVHPPEQPDRVGVLHRLDVEAGGGERGGQRALRSSAGGGRARRRAGRRSAARPARRSAPCRWCRRTTSRNSVSAWTSSSMCSSTLTQTIVSNRSACRSPRSHSSRWHMRIADARLPAQLFAGPPRAVRVGLDADQLRAPGWCRGSAGSSCRCRSRPRARATRGAGAPGRKCDAWYRTASLIVSRSSAAYCFCVWVNLWSTFMPECESRDTVPYAIVLPPPCCPASSASALAGLAAWRSRSRMPPSAARRRGALRPRAASSRPLIAGGANVNERDATGMTPLMVAAAQGQTAIARMLIAAGADVGASSEDGATRADAGGLREPRRDGALPDCRPAPTSTRSSAGGDDGADDRGVRRLYVDPVRALLEKGADANLRDNQGRTGADGRRDGRRRRRGQALLAAGADPRRGRFRRHLGDDLCGGGGVDRRDRGADEERREAGRPRPRCRGRGMPCAGGGPAPDHRSEGERSGARQGAAHRRRERVAAPMR